jgi:hypothetical protein
MNPEEPTVSYQELGDIAEALFQESEDDPIALSGLLDSLDPGIRNDLLVSDFLNAYQVFYYYFRQEPGEMERERMTLEPASSLLHGIRIREIDFYEIFFRVEETQPVMSVTDGEVVLVNYRGSDAYRRAVRYIDENL